MTKLIRLTGWVVCVGALLGAAERPASRGAAPGEPNRRGPAGRNLAARPPRIPPISQKEWEDIQKWMQTYSPNRLKFLLRVETRRSGPFFEARQVAALRYRQINRLAAYPELQKALLEETTAQDQIFGATLELRNSSDPRVQEQADQTLKQSVKKLFEAQIAEKQARVDKLTKEIKEQTEKEPDLVKAWYQRVYNRAMMQRPKPNTEQARPDDTDDSE